MGCAGVWNALMKLDRECYSNLHLTEHGLEFPERQAHGGINRKRTR